MARGTGSVWMMLFWKEWRQQRLAAFLLGLFCLVAYLGYCRENRWEPEGMLLLGLLALAMLCLGTIAFATEADDRSAGFLAQLPLPVWQVLAVKYGFAFGLALLCLVAPTLALPPPFGDWFLGGLLSGNRAPALSTAAALLLASNAIAIAGALARQGMGGMPTLLTGGALGAVLCVVLHVASGELSLAARYRGLWWPAPLVPFVAAWTVAHLWLVRTWLGSRTTRWAIWRRGVWPCLLFLVPVLSTVLVGFVPRWVAVGYEHAVRGPRQWARRGSIMAAAAPDGRTVAVTTYHNTRPSFGNAATWLLDVDTNHIRRLGPRWRVSFLDPPVPNPTCWSPDGGELRLFTHPIPWQEWDNSSKLLKQMDEWSFRMQGGKATLAGRHPAPDFGGFSWLGDGTRAAWRRGYWEFILPGTGEVRQCKYPVQDPADSDNWDIYRRFWTDHAITAIRVRGEGEARQWQLWRSAPDLAETERRNLVLPPLVAGDGIYPLALSPDGNWLLLSQRGKPWPTHWLYPLAEGRFRQVDPDNSDISRGGFFTPDSEWLVIPGEQALHVWNLAEERWEPAVPVPPPARLRGSPNDLANPHYAVSPRPPWRVAISASPRTVYVLDLATRTAVLALPPDASGDPSAPSDRVQWLGNDRLLVQREHPARLWVANADGSGNRQVLP